MVTRREASGMALIPRKVIARLVSVAVGIRRNCPGSGSCEPTGRCTAASPESTAAGNESHAGYRLAAVEMPRLRGTPAWAVALLGELARERGHQAA